MSDKIIAKVIDLMREQSATYGRLDSLCERLSSALVRGDIDLIESLTRMGERELLSLRSKLAQITSALSQFASAGQSAERSPVSEEVRARFEAASRELLINARAFQRTGGKIAGLSINGASFASACIEMCGVQPTTYSAGSFGRRGDNRTWA